MPFPLLLLLFPPIASSLSNFPIVTTSYGAVRGYEYQTDSGFVGEIFKKIPFASPPVGERRWKKAVPPEPWNYTLDGTFFGPACAQIPSDWDGYITGHSEDCLIINIYTSKECRESNASCPVLFYIHGGAAQFSGPHLFDEETLVMNYPRNGVILVTTHYRLGIFGATALGNENVMPANLDMHDILESLRFVSREIHAFGGDKDQITIMGQSTGATIVLAFTFSPTVNKPGEPPLFARGISMSPTAIFEPEEKQIYRTHLIATKLGCTGEAQEIIDCMMPLSTEVILKAAEEVGADDPFSADALTGIAFAGELMPIHNNKELRDNQQEHVKGGLNLNLAMPTKLLIGTVMKEFELDGTWSNDAWMKAKYEKDRKNQVVDVLGVRNPEECTEKYYSDRDSGKFTPGYETLSQAHFMTVSLFASAQAKAGGEVYLYQLDYPRHAKHADDLYYVMGVESHAPERDSNEYWLSRVYPVYFTNFIKGVSPAPDWKPLEPELMNYYSINKSLTDGVTPKMKLGYHHNLADYYEGMMKYDANLTIAKKMLFKAPVQYKELILFQSESFNLRVCIFYGAILGVILFAVFRCFQNYRERRFDADEESLLIKR